MHRATPSFIVTARGWAPPIPPSPAAKVTRPRSVPPKCWRGGWGARRGELGERLERALQDALGADVDPRPSGHLAVHRQALALELAEDLPGGPLADQVRIGDQDPGRPFVGPEDGDGLR